MPFFSSYDNLREWGKAKDVRNYSFIKEGRILSGKNTFLSHRSIDDDKIQGAARILEDHGARVYLDHHDPHSASKNCVEIASHIRAVIKQCPRFVMLVTPESHDSKWMPWEMGLADGIHSESSVALFPAAEKNYDHDWAEQEYLGLYKKIVLGKLKEDGNLIWLVRDAGDITATPLAEWLRD